MQLGFVIDHTKCIGCHACTVACKAENDVPLGNFRTWVKYTEQGTFPSVKRSFAVLRCNQCTSPLKGAKRLVSISSVVRFGFGVFKIMVVAAVASWSLWANRKTTTR